MSEDILQPETWRERDESSDSEPVLSLFKQFLHCKLRNPFIPLKDQRCQPEALKRSNDVVTIDALVSPRALLWLHGVHFIKRSDLQSTGGWAIGNNRRFGTNLISPEFIGNSWTCPQVYRVGDAVMRLDARCTMLLDFFQDQPPLGQASTTQFAILHIRHCSHLLVLASQRSDEATCVVLTPSLDRDYPYTTHAAFTIPPPEKVHLR